MGAERREPEKIIRATGNTLGATHMRGVVTGGNIDLSKADQKPDLEVVKEIFQEFVQIQDKVHLVESCTHCSANLRYWDQVSQDCTLGDHCAIKAAVSSNKKE